MSLMVGGRSPSRGELPTLDYSLISLRDGPDGGGELRICGFNTMG